MMPISSWIAGCLTRAEIDMADWDALTGQIELDQVDAEVAKQFLTVVQARLDAQTKAVDNLRARVMDVARLSVALTTLSAGLAATAIGDAAKAAQLWGCGTAAAIWTLAGLVSLRGYLTRSWGFPGWAPQEWVVAPGSLSGKAVPILLGLALNRAEDIAMNRRTLADLAAILSWAIRLMVLAAPAGAGVAWLAT